VKAWAKRVDCVVIPRDAAIKLQGTSRLAPTQAEQFLKDIEPWFPYQECLYFHGQIWADVFASRVPLAGHIVAGRMGTSDRINRLRWKGIKTARLDELLDNGFPDLDTIVSELALYAAGVDAPGGEDDR
jgi:hypothetical protein